MGASWVLLALVLGFAAGAARASEPWSNGTQVYSTNAHSGGGNGAFVGLTLIQLAAARGAGKSLIPPQKKTLILQQLFLLGVIFFLLLQRSCTLLLAVSRGMGRVCLPETESSSCVMAVAAVLTLVPAEYTCI
jgi:hypothetical protein